MAGSIFFCLFLFYRAQYSNCQESNFENVTTSLGLQILQTGINETKNLIYSPIGISVLTAMLYTGTRGKTKAQISKHMFNGVTDQVVNEVYKKGIDLWLNDQTGYNESYGGGIFIDNKYPILPEYQSTLLKYYGEKAVSVDLLKNPESSRQKINSWVEDHTHNEIKNLLPEHFVDNAVMVATNVLYFKANWKYMFNVSETAKKDFFRAQNDKSVVDIMSQSNRQFYYFEDANAKVLGLPFDIKQEKALTMFIILPAKRFGLDKLIRSLTVERFRQLITEGRERTISKVELPRFKTESNWNGATVFKKFGLTDMFDSQKADFSGISGSKGLFLSDFMNSLVLEINEEGALAVGVQGGTGMRMRTIQAPITFQVDQPFVFAIIEKATLQLDFMGRIVDI